MKKLKRVLALVGVLMLLALYISTIFFAITDNSQTLDMFKAAVLATIVIPILLWSYTCVYKYVKKRYEEKKNKGKG